MYMVPSPLGILPMLLDIHGILYTPGLSYCFWPTVWAVIPWFSTGLTRLLMHCPISSIIYIIHQTSSEI